MSQELMTSGALMRLLSLGYEVFMGAPAPLGLSKGELLNEVLDAKGPRAVFSIGLMLEQLNDHPVVRALTVDPHPDEIIARWMSLERFGHARHRTRRVDVSSHQGIALEHICLDGRAIDPVNDLFVWGVLIALLLCAEVGELEASLLQPDATVLPLYGARSVEVVPAQTSTLLLSWAPRCRHELRPERAWVQASMGEQLEALITQDLLRPWSVTAAARALMTSARSLQRALRAEQRSFAQVLQRCRVNAAFNMLKDPALPLTEIAFCAGFSDQAHLSRSFKRFFDVSPSQVRAALLEGAT